MKSWLTKNDPYQTRLEEFFNALTHAAGIGLSVAALVLLTVFSAIQEDATKIIACIIFGTSLILMYTASTVYHTVTSQKVKRFFKLVDHTAIYGVIAGTYTPIVLIILHGAWGWTLFGLIWVLAIMGFVFKVFFIGRFENLSVAIYIGMGWLAIIAIEPLWHALPLGGFCWLFAGGISYTVGVKFFRMDRVRFAHTLWHLFVLIGSICHFFLILLYVIPVQMK